MSVNSLFKPNDYTIYVNANNLNQADLPIADQSFTNFTVFENSAGKLGRRNIANGFSAASTADQIIVASTPTRFTGPFAEAYDVGARLNNLNGQYTAGPANGSFSLKATLNIVSLTAIAGDIITVQFGTNADISTPRLLSQSFTFASGQTTATIELEGTAQLINGTVYTFSIVPAARPVTISTGSIIAGQANF